LRGNIAIIAISTVLLLGYTGFNTSPVFGGGGNECQDLQSLDICFDGDTDQDWNTAANWGPLDGIPSSADRIGIGYNPDSTTSVSFDVNINSPNTVMLEDSSGHLEIKGGSTLTVKDGATLDNSASPTIVVHTGATLTVDGLLLNQATGVITVDGLLVVTGTGTLTNFGNIAGTGDLEVCGTLIDTGTITVNQVACSAGAPVGSVSIPLDSIPMLVAESQSFSWMIPVLLSAIGIGLFVVSRKSENSKI